MVCGDAGYIAVTCRALSRRVIYLPWVVLSQTASQKLVTLSHHFEVYEYSERPFDPVVFFESTYAYSEGFYMVESVRGNKNQGESVLAKSNLDVKTLSVFLMISDSQYQVSVKQLMVPIRHPKQVALFPFCIFVTLLLLLLLL